MKNLTVSLDDESYRLARIRAAQAGTSVSAMVKRFLTGGEPQAKGVREMPMSFTHAPVANFLPQGAKGPDGQPYFVNGKWTFTPDGNPRNFGGLKGKVGMAEDFDEWPEGFVDSMYAVDELLLPSK